MSMLSPRESGPSEKLMFSYTLNSRHLLCIRVILKYLFYILGALIRPINIDIQKLIKRKKTDY